MKLMTYINPRVEDQFNSLPSELKSYILQRDEKINTMADLLRILEQIAEDDDERFMNFDTVASATDCTGLIPTPPLSEDECDSYVELYRIHQPDNDVNNGFQQVHKGPGVSQ